MLSKKYLNLFHHVHKRLFHFFTSFSIMIALSGCSSHTSAPPDGNVPSTLVPSGNENISGSVIVSPELPAATPVPSSAPSADGYSAEAAAQLVSEIIPEERYDISLVSSSLNIGSDMYYTFLITLKGTAIEPLIIVNQKTGELKCISSDNTVSAISGHPLYHELNSEPVSWEGTYIITREDGTLSNYIILTPLDSTRFEFTTYVYLETGISELSGIASIDGDTASFISESGAALYFSWKGADLVIGQHLASQEQNFTGTYHYTEDTDSTIKQISMEEAVQKLLVLTPELSGLAGSMEDYFFYVQDNAVIVSDHLCYSILVYSELNNRLFYTTQFYITVDGACIYRTEDSADGDTKILSIQYR